MSISAYISRLPPPPKEQQIQVRASLDAFLLQLGSLVDSPQWQVSALPPPPKEQQTLVRAIGNSPDWEQPRLFGCVEKTVTLSSLRSGLPGYSFKLRTYYSWSIAAGRGGGHQAGQAARAVHRRRLPRLGWVLGRGRVGGCGMGASAKCMQTLPSQVHPTFDSGASDDVLLLNLFFFLQPPRCANLWATPASSPPFFQSTHRISFAPFTPPNCILLAAPEVREFVGHTRTLHPTLNLP